VKPECGAFLAKSREFLGKEQGMLDHQWPDEAGRAAYLAGLHATQALIFESTGKVVKSHRGVHRELARLMREEPRFDRELRAFLCRAYNHKAIADYENAPGTRVSPESAKDAIQTATRFVECVASLIPVSQR
jgi:uncharacterized protein (UPF0332 family)